MWEPIVAVVLSIFLTILLFTMVYLTAFGIIKGGLFTYRKIKEEFNKDQTEKQDPKKDLGAGFPRRDSVIQDDYNPFRNRNKR